MKIRNATLYCLLILFCLILPTRSWAQRDNVLTKTVKQISESHFKPDQLKSGMPRKWAIEKNSSPTTDQLENWKKILLLSALKKTAGSVKYPDLKSGKNKMPASPQSNWLKTTLLATKKRLPTARPVLSAARTSATAVEIPDTLYVNYQATGAGTGATWDDAYTELADALRFARNNAGVLQIWVANGIYHPLYDPEFLETGIAGEARDRAFVLVPDVKLYGGFAGYETSVAERDLRIYAGSSYAALTGGDFATILSGDLLDDDYDGGSNPTAENTHRVIISAGNVGAAVLDGFVIAGGNADTGGIISVNDEEFSRRDGGGMTVINSSPSLVNLLFSDNNARYGGAIYANASNFTLTNALIINNNSYSGTINVLNSAPVITNATIASNSADLEGSGITFEGDLTSGVVRNSIIYGNGETTHSKISRIENASASFAFSLVEGIGSGWDPAVGADLGGNMNLPYSSQDAALPDYEDRVFYDPLNGNFALRIGSPAINKGNNLYFEALQSPDLTGIETDLRGTGRIQKEMIDMGALESLYGMLTSNLVPNADGLLFVKKGGAGSKDGSSWENAAAEVADALFAAHVNRSGPNEIANIWVAGGTYLPLYRADDLSNADLKSRDNAFVLADGVSLYGGFAGGESSLEERDLSLTENASILSGDFENDDQFDFADLYYNGPKEAFEENAHHVVFAVGLRNYGAALNGFTVQNAYNLTLDSETFLINETEVPLTIGAGIYVQEAAPLIENVVVKNNLGYLGAGLTHVTAAAAVTNAAIYHNLDFGAGSGIFDLISYQLTLSNTTVTRNLSVPVGPAVSILAGTIDIGNSIIAENMVLDPEYPSGYDLAAEGVNGTISHSIVAGSGGSSNWLLVDPVFENDIGDAGGNLDEDPAFKDIYAGDFSLSACSRAIDAGDKSLSQRTKDLIGNDRVFNNELDMGAFEFQGLQSSGAGGLAGSGKQSSFDFVANASHTFTAKTGVCDVDLLTLTPTDLAGEVTSKVWFDDLVNAYNNAFYLQRHYDITPVNNAENATAAVILYFTQAEFDSLNAKLAPAEYLPTGQSSGETARKANLRIYQFHGESEDGSGEPWSYGGSRTEINPDDDDITWNAVLNRWEVTFAVSGFSGFFGGTVTQNPLPVRLISFDGKLADDRNVKLDWKVTEQENIAVYQVEYSATGKKFTNIGQVIANTLVSTDYDFTDTLSHMGNLAYYRLKINEVDGKTAYSKIISVKLSHLESMIAYPVPAKNELWIDWKKSNAVSADLIDVSGKVLKTVKKSSGLQKVDLSATPAGLYILKSKDNNGLKVVKE